MRTTKRQLQAHNKRVAAIQTIAIEARALDSDACSNLDLEADKETYVRAFRAWADGKIQGTAKEIFEAVTDVLSV